MQNGLSKVGYMFFLRDDVERKRQNASTCKKERQIASTCRGWEVG